MKNSFLSSCRSNKGRTVCIDDVDPELLSSHDHADDRVLAHEVLTAVDKLPPKLRHALTVICGGELSYDEASVALSCTIGTVKSRLWRARTQLKQSLMGVTDGVAYSNAAQTTFAAA
jgi:RNA polymerase sigma-70 factor (ECF subfamily)